MSEINNYIPISRKIFEHQFWCEDRVYSRFEAWIDIIQITRVEDTELLIGNRLTTVKRGQLPVSLRYLAERWKWSTKKVNNFLGLLILAQMITKETLKETGQTLITVCNYDNYNFYFEKWKHKKKQKGNTKETGGKQEGNKNNNDNNLNNLNNTPPLPSPNGEGDVVVKTWRDDFQIYLKSLRNAYKKFLDDKDYITERERFHPGIDIKLSLEKACKDFWSKEAGWKKKKNSKTVEIDWKETFNNALDLKSNQVWKTKEQLKNETDKQSKVAYIDV